MSQRDLSLSLPVSFTPASRNFCSRLPYLLLPHPVTFAPTSRIFYSRPVSSTPASRNFCSRFPPLSVVVSSSVPFLLRNITKCCEFFSQFLLVPGTLRTPLENPAFRPLPLFLFFPGSSLPFPIHNFQLA